MSRNVIKPNNMKVARIYALWQSMPFAIKELPDKRLETLGFDIEDETFMKLKSIRTQTQFAKEFKMSREELSRWNKCKVVIDMIKEFSEANNVMKFKKDIDFHFTQKTIREADAARVKLWKELYEGFEEKHKIGGSIVNIDAANILQLIKDATNVHKRGTRGSGKGKPKS